LVSYKVAEPAPLPSTVASTVAQIILFEIIDKLDGVIALPEGVAPECTYERADEAIEIAKDLLAGSFMYSVTNIKALFDAAVIKIMYVGPETGIPTDEYELSVSFGGTGMSGPHPVKVTVCPEAEARTLLNRAKKIINDAKVKIDLDFGAYTMKQLEAVIIARVEAELAKEGIIGLDIEVYKDWDNAGKFDVWFKTIVEYEDEDVPIFNDHPPASITVSMAAPATDGQTNRIVRAALNSIVAQGVEIGITDLLRLYSDGDRLPQNDSEFMNAANNRAWGMLGEIGNISSHISATGRNWFEEVTIKVGRHPENNNRFAVTIGMSFWVENSPEEVYDYANVKISEKAG
jgi:hypothetical protein